tara:strand:- start:317 stop:964 length:648 start_codon:yes stop_codon:yes gene_type:complete
MNRFPALCVDNFYQRPDEVVNFAKQQSFKKSKYGNFPGKRTLAIHTLNKNIFNYTCAKLFSMFYDFDKENLDWNVVTNFDLIEQDIKEDGLGWIHQDDNKFILAGLIYLNKDWQNSAGTSLYHKVNNYDDQLSSFKKDYFLGTINRNDYLKAKDKHNSSFVETASFKPVYNRMICFDSSSFHSIGDINNLKTDRLVQVFFVESLKTFKYPMERIC